MQFIDMFAGIGGFRTGLENAGHTCVGYIEIDKFARQSYEAIYDTRGEFTAYDIQKVQGGGTPKR
ncbi:DNA cytosine methyltransferase [Lactobacillus sp.]|uniref:DNA cytosine methyltransferase n=1 Tax=Lactobacillus sp. TaxID=1591 RepID=UPI001999B4D5|nr:DNA cytosine methyltransferase [Lactobacillus sp.]